MILPATPFENNKNETATYVETINFYKELAKNKEVALLEYGTTDAGQPLHLVVLSTDQDFDPVSLRNKNKRILLVNNAIHPGEPCGVDASMLLLKEYLQDSKKQVLLENIVIAIIPIYNIGGALNRNSHTRTNQNGPVAYGFRGNAKNLDLNRDFIKCDSKNAETFAKLYQEWQPDVFIDNHTSNGADYPYTMTLIPTLADKLDPTLAEYLEQKMLPRLFQGMKDQNWEMTPYVYARDTPDKGIASFCDHPRYSSGYASLHNTLSFIPETHMLKPFNDRVKSTQAFMDVMIGIIHDDDQRIAAARSKAMSYTASRSNFNLNWTLDMERVEEINFKGYEAGYKISEVSGLERLFYDQNKPYEKKIPYIKHYKSTQDVDKPRAYIIPQAYHKVIDRLKWNGVAMSRLKEDKTIQVDMYRIKDFKTTDSPWEGHYFHSNVEVEKLKQEWKFYKGDYVIVTNQKSNRYIVETLEPQGADSFFAWNFFDGILMQKEYFSDYVFEDLAAEYLKENPSLRVGLAAKRAEDPEFSKSSKAQLEYVYKRTPHYEKTHRLYPIGRYFGDLNEVID